MHRINPIKLWLEYRDVAEFQSALVRLAIWFFAAAYVGLSSFSEHHEVHMPYYVALFSTYLIIFLIIFISVLWRKAWEARRYLTLVVDCTATGFAIFLTGSPHSPFFILYLWIFISYGTRYGSQHLFAASVASVVSYLIVCIALQAWVIHAFEMIFILLSLVFLPAYQFVLLEKLHKARQQAEASSHAKAAFLANMSHEIRTPMNGLLSMGELLQRSELDDTQHEYLGKMLSSGRALTTVLNDILDYSKIEAGVLKVNRNAFSLRELIEDVAVLIEHSATEKALHLETVIESDVPAWVMGDSARIRQILINLLGNAVRFTDKGRVVLRIRVRRRQANAAPVLCFQVSDTGIGIKAEDVDKLFKRFSQLDYSLARHHGGSGLGLVISRHLVEAMGGEIGVQSVHGEGSTFWFELPLEVAVEPAGVKTETAYTTHRTDKLRILFVDDDSINRLAGQHLLEAAGNEVMLAEDGLQALEKMQQGHFDVVLMDVHMPNMDGIEATRQIRSTLPDEKANTPIIGVTASVMHDEQQRYLQAGMNAVVAKPVSLADLERTIAEQIGISPDRLKAAHSTAQA